jgi:hypothetical protein
VAVVLATRVGDAAEMLDAHLAFHLAAGADVVLVAGATDDADPARFGDRVRRVDVATHTELARIAVAEHGADWVIPSTADEFWWPRGESLEDVLAVIPPRYAVVQALVRTFAGPRSAGRLFFEAMTVRTSLLGPQGAGEHSPTELLRPIYRAEPGMVLDPTDWTLHGRRVPLRAWYPIEVFRYPVEAVVSADRVDDLLADGRLVVDTRLRDVLRSLETSPDGVGRIAVPVPDVVDDASYAVECAAVGEVDIQGLDGQIRELELRIAALEARFWPSVRRRLRRLVSRRR